ncbi:helix-turn-helix transcriptional regulator [Jiangella endophytica]|uniref:helix-turn-helix transcriptional regulator n=1 Tax=Jiangella endophytica TaxID=1623398 RepID=UPI000E350110|nr:helix-turn-helix domain-containing protein [Jiangella endophytica]
MAEPSGPWSLEPLIDIEELAEYLGVPVTTIYDWRTHGKGPPAHRFGKRLKFAVSDVRAWLAAQREPGAG